MREGIARDGGGRLRVVLRSEDDEEDGEIEVRECPTCRSLVADEDDARRGHDRWHAEMRRAG
jgi:hypothetical protein